MELISVEGWKLLDAYCFALHGEHLISSRELKRQDALNQLSNGVKYFYEGEKKLKKLIEEENFSAEDKEKLEKAFTNFNTPDLYTNLAVNIDDEKYAAFEAYYKALHEGEELLPPYKKRLRDARKEFAKRLTYVPAVAKKVLEWMDRPEVDKGTAKHIKKAFTETRIEGEGEFGNTIDDRTLEVLVTYFKILHPNAENTIPEKVLELRKAASILGGELGKYNSGTVKRMIGLVKKKKLEQNDLSDINKTVTHYAISDYNNELSMAIKDEYVDALDDYSKALHNRNFVNEEQRQTRNAIQKLSRHVSKFYSNEKNLLTAIEKLDRNGIDQILIKASKDPFSNNLVFSIDDIKLAAFKEFFEFRHPREPFVSIIAQRFRNAVTQLSTALKGTYSQTLSDFHGLVDKKIKGQMKVNDADSFERTILGYFAFNSDKELTLTISINQLRAFKNYYRELADEELLSEDQERKRNALEKLSNSLKSQYINYKDTLIKIRTPKDIDNTFITSLKFETDSDIALAQYFVDLYDGKEDDGDQEWTQWVDYIKDNLPKQQ